MSANNNEPPATDRHKPDDIKVGQLYTFVVLRFPYRLFNGHGAYIMPGEPFLVIETGHRFDRCTSMLLVCNARGELGLADPWSVARFGVTSSQI